MRYRFDSLEENIFQKFPPRNQGRVTGRRSGTEEAGGCLRNRMLDPRALRTLSSRHRWDVRGKHVWGTEAQVRGRERPGVLRTEPPHAPTPCPAHARWCGSDSLSQRPGGHALGGRTPLVLSNPGQPCAWAGTGRDVDNGPITPSLYGFQMCASAISRRSDNYLQVQVMGACDGGDWGPAAPNPAGPAAGGPGPASPWVGHPPRLFSKGL